MKFVQKLSESIQKTGSCLCIGLDPNAKRIPETVKKEHTKPEEQVLHFLKEVIDATSDTCAAYKPNLGFFEALGAHGLNVFKEIIDYIPKDKIILADVKRGDISSTAEHYARAYFEKFDVDAVTLNPLMGFESLEPFLQYPQKAVFVLTLTSNPGADDFFTRPFAERKTMADYIAGKLVEYDEKFVAHVGMVVGATKPEKIKPIIEHHPAASLLIPGIGAQGGSIEPLASILKNHRGKPLINSSRSILYAGQEADNWQQAVADKAIEFKKALHSLTCGLTS